MPAPKTRKWRAWLNLQPGSENQLHVTGDVEVSATNKEPVLRRAQPQGINPKILILDLSIRELGIGEQVITWREAQYMEMRCRPGPIHPSRNPVGDVNDRHDRQDRGDALTGAPPAGSPSRRSLQAERSTPASRGSRENALAGNSRRASGNSQSARAPVSPRLKRHVCRSSGSAAANAAQVRRETFRPPAGSRTDFDRITSMPTLRAASASA